jgi:hypothetical protein
MTRLKRWAGRASVLTAVTVLGAMALSGVAAADTLQDTIADTGTGVTLVAGSGVSGSAAIRLIGNSAAGDPDPGCNIDTGDAALKLDIVTPAGVTANPDPLSITSCGTDFSVSLTASSSAVSGHVTVTVLSGPAGGGTYVNQVDIPITVTQPAPTNTKPSVAVTGVTGGASYEIGGVPTAGCAVTDAEDGNSTKAATITGTLTNGLGTQTATCDYTDLGGLAADTATATYSIVPPPNTKPSVAVTGVTDGASYEIGGVPTAGCAVTDAEDGNSTKAATITGTLSHGLGTQTATCDYTDLGGLAADTATAAYTIVDTGNPTISHSLNPTSANSNNWYKQDVSVSFTCNDAGSGVQSCEGNTVLGQGADQSVVGTATDWAGNTATDTVSGINIDESDPTVSLVGGPSDGTSYYFGEVPTAPICEASDQPDLSGLDGTCSVDTGAGGASVGSHSYKSTVTDRAGNTASATVNYTVLAWTMKGFYQPVDMSGVWNTVKGGSTVPLKFEIFSGSTEQTATSAVKSFTQKTVACPNSTATVDEIELTTTGGTSLRYDSTAGQFVQNWATPKKPGTCYTTTMTAQDGSSISANFLLK